MRGRVATGSALAGGAGGSAAGGLPPGEQVLLALARWAGAQGARIALRRRLALGPGLLDELAGDADAALDLARVPVEERLDGVGDRAEGQAGGLGALVAPAVEAGVLAGRGDPDREHVLVARAVLLEPGRRDPDQPGVI